MAIRLSDKLVSGAVNQILAGTENVYDEIESKFQSIINGELRDSIADVIADLVNYYRKTETYSKNEVDQIVDAIKQFTYEIVLVLPTASADTMNKIYLVKETEGETGDNYNEYITIKTGSEGAWVYNWENIGNTRIDLSNYYTKAESDKNLSDGLDLKVDKVTGYSLMSDAEHDKLSGIASGAEVNVQSDWNESDINSDAFIKNKPSALKNPNSLIIQRNTTNLDSYDGSEGKTINISVPEKTSELTNDSNFPVDSNYVHTDNNYTTAEKTKLSGIASGAEVNVQSDWNEDDNTKDDFIKNKPESLKNPNALTFGSKTYDGSEAKEITASDLGAITDVSGKADKVSAATAGHFASLDASGNLADSGKKATDFEPADNTIIKQANIVDNLTSTSTTAPLSANQGKVLNEAKESLSNKSTELTSTSTDTQYPTSKAVYDRTMKYSEYSIITDAPSIDVAEAYRNAKDLSMYNIYNTMYSGMTTANCYVVKNPGWYKIPLVYGNGVKFGSANPAAYTQITGDYTAAFVNHLGNTLTSPFIEENTGCEAASTTLIWQDTENMISNLSIVSGGDCRFLLFKVNTIPTLGANCVLGVKDADGNIIWSWHIWVYPESLRPITLTNHTGVKYNVLPVNLGWKKSSASSKYGTNPYFQWGRKDPIIPSTAYNSTTNITTYGDYNYSAILGTTVAYSIQNPHKFLIQVNEVTYNWNELEYFYNFWDANCTSTGASDNVSVKTIYDPCPSGFKVPTGRAFTGFTTTGSYTSDSTQFNVVGSFDVGWMFKADSYDGVGKYFPASGSRSRASGGLDSVGSTGYCWSSAAHSQSYAYYLNFSSGYVSPLSNSYRAYGFAVRPAADIL